jgi:hypothetical protein
MAIYQMDQPIRNNSKLAFQRLSDITGKYGIRPINCHRNGRERGRVNDKQIMKPGDQYTFQGEKTNLEEFCFSFGLTPPER